MKKGILIAAAPMVLIAVGAAAYTGISWKTGSSLETRLAEQQKLIESSPVLKIANNTYQRGIFSSLQEYDITLNEACLASMSGRPDAKVPGVKIRVRNEIKHGPFPEIGSFNFTRNDAIVVTKLVFEGEAQKALQEVYGSVDPIAIRTLLKSDGGGVTYMTLAPVSKTDKSGVKVDWKGLTGEVSFTQGYATVKGNFNGPGMEVTHPKGGKAQIGALQLTVDMTKNASGMYLGKSTASIAKIDVDSPAAPGGPVRIGKMSLSAYASEKGEFVDAGYDLSVDKVVAMGKEYGPGSYVLELKHLHTPSVVKLQKAIEDIQRQCRPSKETAGQMQGALLQHGIAILQNQPEIHLNKLALKMPEGEASLSAKVRLDRFNLEEAKQPLSMLKNLTASADLSLPAVLVEMLAVERIAKQAARSYGEDSEDEGQDDPKARAKAIYEQQLAQLLEQGFVKQENGKLVSKAAWKDGKLVVNGQPVPLPFLDGSSGDVAPGSGDVSPEPSSGQ